MSPSGPLVGVLALQGDVREHRWACESSGARTTTVRRRSELDGVDALVLPGGESTTMARLLGITGLLAPLRDRIGAGLPVYGSCAGMILLADGLLDGEPDQVTVGGLRATVRRNAFGRQVDSFEEDTPVAGLSGGPVRAVYIRAPWVERHDADVEVLARVVSPGPARGRVTAVRQGTVMATSFHPEMTGDARLHALFVAGIDR